MLLKLIIRILLVSIGLVILNFITFQYAHFILGEDSFDDMGVLIDLPKFVGLFLRKYLFFNLFAEPFEFFSPVVTVLGLVGFFIYERYYFEDMSSVKGLIVSDSGFIFLSLLLIAGLYLFFWGVVLGNLTVLIHVLINSLHIPFMFWVDFVPYTMEYFSDPIIFLQTRDYQFGAFDIWTFIFLTIIFQISIFRLFTRSSKYSNINGEEGLKILLNPYDAYFEATLLGVIRFIFKKISNFFINVYNSIIKAYYKNKFISIVLFLFYLPLFIFRIYPF
jgi:hypothetical protein